MANVLIEADVAVVERLMTEAPKVLHKHWKAAFEAIGEEFSEFFKRMQLTGRPGLNRRGGDLQRSLGPAVTIGKKFEDLQMTLPIGTKYAHIHDTGGTIHGRPWLAIPVGRALTPTGLSRGGPRDFANLFFIRSKKGNLLLARSIGKRTKQAKESGYNYEIMFVLKRSVNIPPRLKFAETWNEFGPRYVRKHLLAANDLAVEDAAKVAATAKGGA